MKINVFIGSEEYVNWARIKKYGAYKKIKLF